MLNATVCITFATLVLSPGLHMAAAPLEPTTRVQLAAESDSTSRNMRREEESDQDSDEFRLSEHRKLMPGQKPGTYVTGAPKGYDAKHLNRIWGRFQGAKGNTKEEKTHKSNGGEAGSRPTRWAR